ncbi:hypothetical protein [Ferrimonas marina]|uniref:Uncharacterized protein n=1 Tax=Ferrimonas marina TaxID=299255 RepID=A0A1M5U4D4_9GAMM|nr:hypothetical protein [Ferrimonas marina]SHH57721.1 hypothetical protein SAMN02745129_2400 [Ferrimonas marina]
MQGIITTPKQHAALIREVANATGTDRKDIESVVARRLFDGKDHHAAISWLKSRPKTVAGTVASRLNTGPASALVARRLKEMDTLLRRHKVAQEQLQTFFAGIKPAPSFARDYPNASVEEKAFAGALARAIATSPEQISVSTGGLDQPVSSTSHPFTMVIEFGQYRLHVEGGFIRPHRNKCTSVSLREVYCYHRLPSSGRRFPIEHLTRFLDHHIAVCLDKLIFDLPLAPLPVSAACLNLLLDELLADQTATPAPAQALSEDLFHALRARMDCMESTFEDAQKRIEESELDFEIHIGDDSSDDTEQTACLLLTFSPSGAHWAIGVHDSFEDDSFAIEASGYLGRDDFTLHGSDDQQRNVTCEADRMLSDRVQFASEHLQVANHASRLEELLSKGNLGGQWDDTIHTISQILEQASA